MIEQGRPIDWQTVVARQWPMVLPALLLAAVCAGHFVGVVREDYGAYIAMFAWARTVEWTGLLSFPYRDYGFGALLFLFAKVLPASDALWFFLIALLGLGVKFHCFRQFAPAYWIALLVHASMFFVLQDYTQLRASLGIAFLMLGAGFLVSREHCGRVTGSWILAAGFHVQSLFAMLLALACVFSMAAFLGGTALSLLAGQLFAWAAEYSERLAFYVASATVQQTPNPFSSMKLYQYLTLTFFFYYRADIHARGWKMVDLSGWFLLAGLAIFIGLLRFPAVAHRLSEMLFAFMPFLVSGLFVLMPKRFGIPYVVAAVGIGVWASYRVLYVWQ
jgi:hypothetical protein